MGRGKSHHVVFFLVVRYQRDAEFRSHGLDF